MTFNSFKAFWAAVICTLLLMIPGLASAQESEDADSIAQDEVVQDTPEEMPKNFTAKDNFGGWKFGADILFGKGRCDDKMCLGQPDGQHWNRESTSFAVKMQLQLSYLWGENVFFGPVLTAFGGYPSFVGGDIRLKLVIPVGKHKNDAVSASAGWGMQIREKLLSEDFFDSYKTEHPHMKADLPSDIYEYGYSYIPIELTYEHIFDNRFIIGASAQLNIAIISRYYILMGDDVGYIHIPAMDMLGLGVHMGYKF